MLRLRQFLVLLFALAGSVFGSETGITVGLLDRSGEKVLGKYDLQTKREVSTGGVETIRCRVEMKDSETSFLRIEASVQIRQEVSRVFDGRSSSPFGGKCQKALLEDCVFPLGAVWGGGKGLALALGVTGADSKAHFSVQDGNMKISVPAAFLRKGATYETVFHLIPFDPKYGECDAIARYYALYPHVFCRNRKVDPGIYGISAQYGSWRRADSEWCRFANASWEWCHSAARSWGDACNEWRPEMPQFGDWSWEEEIGCYRNRAGRTFRLLNASLSQADFDRICRERLGFGYFCGVINGFYMMALCNISNIIAEKYPDSIACGEELAQNGYPYSSLVFTFPEVGWGHELRRQLALLARKYDAGAVAFDVSSPDQAYRGSALRQMSNVSWDRKGACVVRGVGTYKTMEYVHSLETHDGSGRMGVIVNSGHGHILDKFNADMVMSEAAPWNIGRAEILSLRRAMGEKGVTFWEGFSLEEFDPNVAKWDEVDRSRLVNELSHAAVHMSFGAGISLPAGFLSEYTSLASHAFLAVNEAGYKPVPGAEAVGEGWELTRYGLGADSYLTVNNLQRQSGHVKIKVYPDEIGTGFAGGGKSCGRGYLYASYYGGETRNRFGADFDAVGMKVGPHLIGVLEAVGETFGRGEAGVEWSGDFDKAVLTVRSRDYSGKLNVRSAFGTYRLEGPGTCDMSAGQVRSFAYVNTALPGALALLRACGKVDRINYAPDSDSRDMAERVAAFLLGASGQTPELAENVDCGVRTIRFGGVVVSSPSRWAFARLVGRILNAWNHECFPSYRPPYAMGDEDRAYFGFVRY